MIIPTSLPPPVTQILRHYLNLQLGDKQITCPYFISKKATRWDLLFNYRLQGKGSPAEIENLTKHIAQQSNFNLNQATSSQIRQFMRRKGIGVDCSGFTYHLLKAFHQSETITDISTILKRPISFNPLNWLRHIRYRLDVRAFTSLRNSYPLSQLNQLRPGDLIRMESGKHVLIILEHKNNQIIYAHSSYKTTKIKGVHLSKITITKPSQSLENQIWHERTPSRKSLKTHYHPENEDGIFRLKAWDVVPAKAGIHALKLKSRHGSRYTSG